MGRYPIALVDYGAGNLTSVRKGFAAAGAELFTPAVPSDLAHAAAVVVPGVGHFGSTGVLGHEWIARLRLALEDRTPLFGICLGLQWLFDGSDEAPETPGFGLIPARCTRLPTGNKVPHVGWNSIEMTKPSRLLAGIADGTQMYFTHAFAAPVTKECVATTTHGVTFAAAVEMPTVFGVQFHPEKSGRAGIRILENFVAIAKAR